MNIKRFGRFNHDVIVIDGFYGTGKSLVFPIIGSLAGVEKIQHKVIYEQLCVLNSFNKIDQRSCEELIAYHADMHQYNDLVGRETNIKYGDDTSIFNYPNKSKYLKRILLKSYKDDNTSKDFALQIFTHNLLSVSSPLFSSLGERLKFVEVVRHPLYVVQHFSIALERLYLETKSQFELCIEVDGVKIPWFAKDYSKEFISANNVERAIICMSSLFADIEKVIDNSKFLILSFESFVTSPNSNIDKICNFLGREKPSDITSVLKKQKIPRKNISAGKGHAQYGWKDQSNNNEMQIYKSNLKFVQDNCSLENFEKLLELIDWYDEKFPSLLSKLR
jgi:hypothetical protein